MLLEAFLLGGATLALGKYVSSTSKMGQHYVGVGIYYSCMLICSLWGLVLCLFMPLIGRRYSIQWLVARSFYFLASRWMGITITVEGWEHLETRPAIFVGNHQSMIDILYLGRIFPDRCTVMAKKVIKFFPFLGQWMMVAGAVFIDRGNSKSAVESLKQAGQDLKDKELSLWIFPEGTRTNFPTPNLLPFKKGAFHLAVEAGVPIVPVVCENYWRLYHKGHFAGGELKIKVLPPIPTTNLTAADVNQLSIDTRELMLKALQEISEPAPSAAVGRSDNAALAQAAAATTTTSTSEPPPAVVDPTKLSPVISATPSTPTLSSSFVSEASGIVHVGAGSEVRDRKVSVSSAEGSEDMVMVDRPAKGAA